MISSGLRSLYSRYWLSLRYGLRLNKPRLLYRVARNYLGVLLLGKMPLRTMDFAPSYVCNLNCVHCFARTLEDRSRSPLEAGDYRRIVDQADRLGAVHIAFQGGEPLVLGQLESILQAIDTGQFIISITTNGILLKEERIRRLKALGVDFFTVSLDSGIAAEHDAFRGRAQTFDDAMEGVRTALRCGVGVGINTVVTQSLYGEGFQRMIERCSDLGVKLNVLFPAMSGRWTAEYDLMLTEQDQEYFQSLRQRYPFLRRDLDANYVRWGCGAVKEMLYVTAYGDLLPCAFIHVSLGNLRDQPLAALRDRGLSVAEFARYHSCCLAMEDRAFIRDRMAVCSDRRLPLPFEEVFGGAAERVVREVGRP